jgi:hypothetical protein
MHQAEGKSPTEVMKARTLEKKEVVKVDNNGYLAGPSTTGPRHCSPKLFLTSHNSPKLVLSSPIQKLSPD